MHRARGRLIAAAIVLALAGPAEGLESKSLRLLLLSAQDNNTPQTLLRADIAVTAATPQGTRSGDAIALFAPGKEARWYLQIRQPALAALVLGSERKVLQRTDRTPETVPIGATIDDLAISYEDLSRFVESDFKLWQITDESKETVLVGGHPAVESSYLYRAYTFDKERALPLKVQFYAGAFNNLAKLRIDSEHVLVGKKWYPGTIEIQNFPENATTTLRIRWSQAAGAPPELLAPDSFAGAAPLAWPPSPATTTTP